VSCAARPFVAFAVLAAACAVALSVPAAPAAAAPPKVPRAAAAIVVDASDGEVMFQKDPDERREIASTTKLMTALLTLERANPRDVFTAPAYRALPAESRINLRRGERMRVQDLLKALLLESANDAAVTIAGGVAGTRARFVGEMNQRAAQLGLSETSYANPVGLDDPDNYSTARDLAKLAVRLMRNRRFARIVDMPSAQLASGDRRRAIDNRNDLVARYPFVDGIKTGHTLEARYVLVGAAGGPGGARVVSVVLGEPSEAARDAETLELLRWGLGRFHRVRALDAQRVLGRPRVKYRDERAELVPRSGLTVTVRRGERIVRRVDAPDELDGPIDAGARVGSVTVLRGGRPVRRVALVTARDVPGAGALRIALSVLGLPLTLLLVLGILGGATLLALRRRMRVRFVRDQGEHQVRGTR
jgi:serine-type D-Ala-D-Ala carboxypeptidase (penicillin-binding protein 5/6)